MKTSIPRFDTYVGIQSLATNTMYKSKTCWEISNTSWLKLSSSFFKFNFFKDFYLFIERGERRKRERNINVWLPLVRPLLGTWPTTQAGALTGIQPAIFWFKGQHSVHCATPARATLILTRVLISIVSKLPDNLLWKVQETQQKNAEVNKKLYVFGPSVQTNLIFYNH